MRKVLKLIILFGAAALVACSSPPQPSSRVVVDQQYIDQVETAARRNSQRPRIYWVNPPVKRQQQD